MYMVYSFFLIFIMMMLSVLFVNQYKKSFLTALKNDIKTEVQSFHLEINEQIMEENIPENKELSN